jgi:transposase
MPRVGRTRGQPDRRDHWQPKRQERGKRGVSIDPCGYDAGKKIKGKKRHLTVDTEGLLLCAIVHAADIQDRDGGILLMSTMFALFPFLLKLYADSGYQGPKFRQGLQRVCRQINVEIDMRSDVSKFVVLPKRWVVEGTIAWLNRCRRLAKDWECLNRNGLAFLRWASIRPMVRKLSQETKWSRMDSYTWSPEHTVGRHPAASRWADAELFTLRRWEYLEAAPQVQILPPQPLHDAIRYAGLRSGAFMVIRHHRWIFGSA